MSRITDVVILTSTSEDPDDDGAYPAINWINAQLRGSGNIAPVHEHAGGTKSMGSYVFAAGLNHVDLEWLGSQIFHAPWVDPASVQAFYKEEESERFVPFDGAIV